MTHAAQAESSPLESDGDLYCSFCLRSAAEVSKLVAGHGRIFICDGCVATCNDYVTSGVSNRSPNEPIAKRPTENLLMLLKPIEETIDGKSNQLQCVVEELRSRLVSWASIGNALGISRQSAWERFAHADNE